MTTKSVAMLQSQNIKAEQRFLERADENDKMLAATSILHANMRSEERAEDRRMLRHMTLEKRERDMEESIMKRQRDDALKKQQHDQEDRIAREMQKMKLNQFRDEKMRQQIRETSDELRELEAKLRSAYTSKERAAQLAEKEAMKFDEMARDAEVYRRMKDESERASDLRKIMDIKRYGDNVRYQKELERQLEEQEISKQQEFEEQLKEKLMVDEIVRKIYEEDQRERERQSHKKELVRKYVDEFMLQREGWKELEKHRLEEENQRILDFAKLQAEREHARQMAHKEAEEMRSEIVKQLSDQIAKDRNQREEMDQVRQELYEEEQEEKDRRREKEEHDKRRRDMLELQRMEKEQLNFKRMREDAERAEEDEFKKQMLAKFAEDDRIEQMNAQKRRMKQLEHKHSVQALIEDRREQFARERERDLEERQREAQLEAFRKKVIEDERMRMLREHGHNLLGYLPKGVINDASDLEKLGPDFQEQYRHRAQNVFEDGWEEG